jgi:hypothetical protein
MKFIIFCLLLLAFNMQKVKAQRDTVYYLLDTAAVPIKDRMFRMVDEGPFRIYFLACRCYPYSRGIPFIFNINRKRERIINKQEFRQLKISSITELIDFALKSLDPKPVKYNFIFIEPHGEDMKLIDVTLGAPYRSRKVTTATPVPIIHQ